MLTGAAYYTGCPETSRRPETLSLVARAYDYHHVCTRADGYNDDP